MTILQKNDSKWSCDPSFESPEATDSETNNFDKKYTGRRRLSAKCEGSAWPRSSRERVFLLSGKSWQFSKHEIYSKNKNHSSVCTHRFSESFYRVWFTGWFRTSYLFSLFRLNRLNLNYFWLVFCFYVSDSYFMLKMTCMIRFMTRQGLIGLQRGTH